MNFAGIFKVIIMFNVSILCPMHLMEFIKKIIISIIKNEEIMSFPANAEKLNKIKFVFVSVNRVVYGMSTC